MPNLPEEKHPLVETVTEKADESSPPTNEGSQESNAPSHTAIVLEPAPEPEVDEDPVSVEANDAVTPTPAADVVETVQEVETAKVEDAKGESEVVEPVAPAVEPSSHQDEPLEETVGSRNGLALSAADDLPNFPVVPDVEEIPLEPVPSVGAQIVGEVVEPESEVGSEIVEVVLEPESEVKPEGGIGEQEKPVDAEEKSAQVGPHEG